METRANDFSCISKDFSVWRKSQLFSQPTDPLLVGILTIREITGQKFSKQFFKGFLRGRRGEWLGKTWGEQLRICMPIDEFTIH